MQRTEAVRKTRPVRSTRKDLDAAEQPIGQTRTRTMKSTGPAREALEPPLVEPVERPLDPEKAANLAFMEERVTIFIHTSEDPYAVQFPEVWNDSRKATFVRGKDQVTQRKFVEVLARMKVTRYRQEHFVDNNGVQGYRYVPYTALVYPFTVKNDTPKGQEWLARVLAEA